jgi:recombination associated protein RdgC
MWFKNAHIFQFETPVPYDAAQFEQYLSRMIFQPCAKSLPHSYGWTPPLGDYEAPLVYGSNQFMMLCMKVEEKLLPPAVLREQHGVKIKEMETKLERKLYKDEKARIKDDLYGTLLIQAFSKSNDLYAYVDTKNNYLIVDTSSAKRLEQFLSLYSKSVNEHPIFTPKTSSPSILMTKWLKHQKYPAGLSILKSCVLQDTNDERSIARFSHTDLLSEPVQQLLQDGYQVIQLNLNWKEQISFTLKQDFSISNIKFLEGVQEVAKNCYSETIEERFSADFVIMAETLQIFTNELLGIFAEEKESIAA